MAQTCDQGTTEDVSTVNHQMIDTSDEESNEASGEEYPNARKRARRLDSARTTTRLTTYHYFHAYHGLYNYFCKVSRLAMACTITLPTCTVVSSRTSRPFEEEEK